MRQLGKYSIGIGDRFAHQANAQLRAVMQASGPGRVIEPVWNKSHREHTTIGSEPNSVRAAADRAVKDLGWKWPHYVDADHINREIVGGFLESSDFYTIDVADSIGRPADEAAVSQFVDQHPELIGTVEIAERGASLETTAQDLQEAAAQYLLAVQQAGEVYRFIAAAKGEGTFITEVSMDETDRPQTPFELLVILTALADEGIPVQTVAPKFTGRFNKGVDYVGDVEKFETEFNDDLAVIALAIRQYGLPANLKLSVHSGSDKFSLYGPMKRAMDQQQAGVHLKTAGTTWLEELIGLAEADGEGLEAAKQIYAQALARRQDLCAPYATVIDIDPQALPTDAAVGGWSSAQFVNAVRHDPSCGEFNPHMRQLLHVGYKIAATMGERFLKMLEEFEPTVSRNVTENLYQRHLRPLFGDDTAPVATEN